ncbi:hypothetical protein IJT10_06125 [bacterium]|nr:hypothetical protein [bacterium]
MKFLVSELNAKEDKCAILTVKCNENDADKLEKIRDIAHNICKLVASNKDITYLDRKSVPWEETRRLEREAHAKGCEEHKDSELINSKVIDIMAETYGKICLLEFGYDSDRSVGSYLESCRKENGLDFVIEKLNVVRV